ncbi:MAG TPA: hypothetical protein VD886_13700 [Herpetosiphonaceae bacterium]|nr:hypothetical protein [Herpetosiphonaceae bacterium]
MNANTRRFLDEDWLDEEEVKEVEQERERKNEQRPAPDPRRQKQKEWGKAIAKLQRTQNKQSGK